LKVREVKVYFVHHGYLSVMQKIRFIKKTLQIKTNVLNV